MMSATVTLFVFRVSIPFSMNLGFLAISFSMIEIPCWNGSKTSTNSASDLSKSFASLVFAVFSLFSALTSSETRLLISFALLLRLSLCAKILNLCMLFVTIAILLLCWSSSLLQDPLTFAVLGFRLHLHCLLDRGGKDDFSDLVLKTFDVPSCGGLMESISLFCSLLDNWNPPLLSLSRI